MTIIEDAFEKAKVFRVLTAKGTDSMMKGSTLCRGERQ
jgi:hypothetical protein